MAWRLRHRRHGLRRRALEAGATTPPTLDAPGPGAAEIYGAKAMFLLVRLAPCSNSSIAPAGTLAYARRGTPHAYARAGGSPGRLLVMVTPGGLEEYMTELDQLIQEGASEDSIACLNRAWATDVLGPGLSEAPPPEADAY